MQKMCLEKIIKKVNWMHVKFQVAAFLVLIIHYNLHSTRQTGFEECTENTSQNCSADITEVYKL